MFNHARSAGADLTVGFGLSTLKDQTVVTSSHGLGIQPDGVHTGVPDLVVVPDGG